VHYDWSEEKNNILKNRERKVSFEDVLYALKNDQLLDVIPSPTHDNQECLVVMNNYVYIVPFVSDEETIFLKTIYPSRKHTKYYLKG